MSYNLMVWLSYSIVPPMLAAITRCRNADPGYYPMLAYLILGFINECISSYVIPRFQTNALNNNVFSLVETLLILWQFRKWGLFSEYKRLYQALFLVLVLGWAIQNHNWHYLNTYLPFFRSFASLLIVVMSIISMIRLIIIHNGQLLKSPEFLFCAAFGLYFSTAILLEVVLYFGSETTMGLQADVFMAASIVNVVANIIYLIAIVWIPARPRFIIP